VTRPLIIATVALAIVNGIFSPGVLFVFIFYQLWYPSFLPATVETVTTIASLILSTLTLMAAGVPAALYERFRGGGTDDISAAIWLAAAALLTLPALPNLLRAFGPSGV
jgi:hypothetical protein